MALIVFLAEIEFDTVCVRELDELPVDVLDCIELRVPEDDPDDDLDTEILLDVVPDPEGVLVSFEDVVSVTDTELDLLCVVVPEDVPEDVPDRVDVTDPEVVLVDVSERVEIDEEVPDKLDCIEELMDEEVVTVVDAVVDLVSRALNVVETLDDVDLDSRIDDVVDRVDRVVDEPEELDVSDFVELLLPLKVCLDVLVLLNELVTVIVPVDDSDFVLSDDDDDVTVFRGVADEDAEEDKLLLGIYDRVMIEDTDDDFDSCDDRDCVEDDETVLEANLDGVEDKLEDALFDALNDGVSVPVALALLEGRCDAEIVGVPVDERDTLADKELDEDILEDRETEGDDVPVRVDVTDLDG